MHRPFSFILLALCAAVAALASTARADARPDATPGEIAHRCIERMAVISHAQVHQNNRAAHHCVRIIEQLLEDGSDDAAHEAAATCLAGIEADSAAAIDRIRALGRQCRQVLVHLNAPGLAVAVGEAQQRAVDAVQLSRRRAVRAIQAAFDE